MENLQHQNKEGKSEKEGIQQTSNPTQENSSRMALRRSVKTISLNIIG